MGIEIGSGIGRPARSSVVELDWSRTWTSGTTALVNLLNACVIYAAAVGIEQTITYKKAD